MQEECVDFYAESKINGEEMGCCLICSNSEPECLCFNCKCSKCYWYSPPDEWDDENKGHCDYAKILKEKGKKTSRNYYQQLEDEKWRDNLKLKEINEKVAKKIKESGEIPNYYTCFSCKREFCSEEIKKTPVCSICRGVEDGNGTN